jgi:hypothetical protein
MLRRTVLKAALLLSATLALALDSWRILPARLGNVAEGSSKNRRAMPTVPLQEHPTCEVNLSGPLS